MTQKIKNSGPDGRCRQTYVSLTITLHVCPSFVIKISLFSPGSRVRLPTFEHVVVLPILVQSSSVRATSLSKIITLARA